MKIFYSLVIIQAQWNITLQKHTNIILKYTVLSSHSTPLTSFKCLRCDKVTDGLGVCVCVCVGVGVCVCVCGGGGGGGGIFG